MISEHNLNRDMRESFPEDFDLGAWFDWVNERETDCLLAQEFDAWVDSLLDDSVTVVIFN